MLSAVTLASGRVSVLRPDGQPLGTPTPLSSSGVTVTHRLPTSGTYTLVVDPERASTGSVTVTLTQVTSQGAAPLLGTLPLPAGPLGAPRRGPDREGSYPVAHVDQAAWQGAVAGDRGGGKRDGRPSLAAGTAESRV